MKSFNNSLKNISKSFEKYIDDVHCSLINLADNHIHLIADFNNYSYAVFKNNKEIKKYIPNKTILNFHADSSPVRILQGVFASGKTFGCCADVIFKALKMPKCIDGVRRLRACFVRSTYPQLKTTTLKTWLEQTSLIGAPSLNQQPPITSKIAFNDEHGLVVIEIIMISMDKLSDFSKLTSLEVTCGFINECREIPQFIVDLLWDRCGRYPARSNLTDDYKKFLIMDTNPPSTRSWLYKAIEVDKVNGYKMFKQPPAVLFLDGKLSVNKQAENLQNLVGGANFYEDMILKFKDREISEVDEYIRVHAMGEYGSLSLNKRVYHNYNDNIHAGVVNKLEKATVYLGFDFGLTPACLVCQVNNNRLFIIKEFTTERCYISTLISDYVIPFLTENFKDSEIKSIIDPAGASKEGVNGDSCYDALFRNKLNPILAPTNKVRGDGMRIDCVAKWLSRLDEQGKAALLIDKENCKVLREGFLGEYYYKQTTLGVFDDKPAKTHPYSDIHDCLQYVCSYLTRDLEGSRNNYEENAIEYKKMFGIHGKYI